MFLFWCLSFGVLGNFTKEKNMKRSFSVLSLCFAAVFALSLVGGCGGGDSTTPVAPDQDALTKFLEENPDIRDAVDEEEDYDQE